MELKIGMYVRTLNGIVQIDKIQDNVMKDTKGHLHYGDCIKTSYDIIDLIEAGDVLLLHDIENDEDYKSEVISDSQNNLCIVNYDIDRIINLRESLFMNIVEIKSIVTKEQFESILYKVD